MNKTMSAILGFCMITASTGCLASDSNAWKDNAGTINLDEMTATGSGVTFDENIVKITDGGDFTVTGTLSDGMIYIDAAEKVKLRLSGVNITSTTGPAIYFYETEEGLITITEDTQNYLTDSKTYSLSEDDDANAAIFSNDDLEIKGNGSLTVTGNYMHGIASDDDILIENGNITVNSYEHGIKANNLITIAGGNIDITSETGKGIKAEEELIINGGKVNVISKENEGIESKGSLTINGGDITIDAGDDGINTGNSDTETDNTGFGEMPGMPNREEFNPENMPEGMTASQRPSRLQGGQHPDGKPPVDFQPPEGEIPQDRMRPNRQMPQRPDGITGGETDNTNTAQAERPQGTRGGMGAKGDMGGFGMVDEETAAAHAVTINDGNIYIKTNCDGIDSNGNLTINGGTLIIDGPENNGNGALDAQGTMSINAGTVITLSSAGMLQLPRNADGQNILRVNFSQTYEAGTNIAIKASDGTVLMSHTGEKAFSALVFSSKFLETDSEYTVLVNDEEYVTVTQTAGTVTSGNAFGGREGMGGSGGQRPDRQNNRNMHTASKINVYVDGSQLKFDTDPIIKNDSTLVGFRAILEALGAEVTWDGETRTVTALKDGTTIILTIDSDKALVNGEEKQLSIAPEIINNSTMIPVRFISEELDMDVEWNGDTREIRINKKQK